LIIIDSNQLRSHVDLWGRCRGKEPKATGCGWERSLTGLQDVGQVTLDRFARYVLETRSQVEDGRAFLDASWGGFTDSAFGTKPRHVPISKRKNGKVRQQVEGAVFQQVQRRQRVLS